MVLSPFCSQDLLEPPGCPGSPWVPPGCLLGASWVPPGCLLGVSWVLPCLANREPLFGVSRWGHTLNKLDSDKDINMILKKKLDSGSDVNIIL